MCLKGDGDGEGWLSVELSMQDDLKKEKGGQAGRQLNSFK